MKKILPLLAIVSLFSFAAQAQSFLVTDTALHQAALCCYTVNLPATTSAQSLLGFKVKNISDTTKKTRVRKHIISQTTGHDIYFDLDVTMYAPVTNYSMPLNLASGQEIPTHPWDYGFAAEWWSNGYAGSSVVQYTIYDSLNVADSIGIRITYNAIATGIQQEETEATNVYPNPASQVVYVSVLNPSCQLTISQIDGKTLSSLKLQQGRNPVDVSWLAAGVYLYWLSDGTRARKLVIVK